MNKQGAWLQPLVGHAIDLWRLIKFDIRHPHSWSKLRQLKASAKRTNATCFIETGTYLGNTSDRASRYFDQVYTIEIDQALYEKAKLFLSKRKNVKCILGDGTEKLAEVLGLDEVSSCLIFLDGHFSGGVTGIGDEPEPAIKELESLSRYQDKISAIVIDDFRTLSGTDGMPSRSSVFRAIETYFPDYTVLVHLDQILVERRSVAT